MKHCCLCCSLVPLQPSVQILTVSSRLRGAESTTVNGAEKGNAECSEELHVAYEQEVEGEPRHCLFNLAPSSIWQQLLHIGKGSCEYGEWRGARRRVLCALSGLLTEGCWKNAFCFLASFSLSSSCTECTTPKV